MPELSRETSPDVLRHEWVARLRALVADAEAWAARSGWRTREISRTMKDSVLGEYRAPALLMQREDVEVILNPVSRFVPGADGAVDLYRLPAYDDIASLYLSGDEWRIHHVFRRRGVGAGALEPEVMGWSERDFLRVLEAVAADAA